MRGREAMASVTVLGGALGAGKTSLLNHLLAAEHGARIGVLVNDFGEVGIDASLVVGVEGETVQLAGGCVCCSIRDDLLGALQGLLDRPNPPQHIVLELSGVSDPRPVLETLEIAARTGWAEVDAVVVMVDAERLPRLRTRERVVVGGQIAAADVLVINKCDLVDAAALERLEAKLRRKAPRARILRAEHGRVAPPLVLGVGAYDPLRLCSAHDHDHDHDRVRGTGFVAMGFVSERPLSSRRLRRAVNGLPPTVVRAKGRVLLARHPDRAAVLHVVGRRAELRLDAPWGDSPPRTEIAVIAAADELDEDGVRRLFAGCEVDERGDGPVHGVVRWVRDRIAP